MSKNLKFIAMMLLATSVVGCGVNQNTEKPFTSQTEESKEDTANTEENTGNEQKPGSSTKQWLYSNLVDDSVKEEVKERLLKAGIPQEDVELFINWVNEYNGQLEEIDLLQKEFALSEGSQITYDDVYLRLDENKDEYYTRMDTNCRLTAALLMKDLIKVGDYNQEPDNYLMFDMESIDNDKKYETIKEQRQKFVTLYNPVEVPDNTNMAEHIEKIQEAWKERGITFDEETNASLVTLFLHDPYEHKRFVGHVGVLVEDEEGLMFVEKYGSVSPYQVTKLDSEDELVEYLLNRADLVGDELEGKPIVMKNNQILNKNI